MIIKRNILTKIVFPVLVVSTVMLSNINANEKIVSAATPGGKNVINSMPVPPTGPYRSTLYNMNRSERSIENSLEKIKQWTPPVQPDGNKSLTAQSENNPVSESTGKIPVDNKQFLRHQMPRPEPAPEPQIMPSRFYPRFNRDVRNRSNLQYYPAYNARQWAPPTPPPWLAQQHRFIPPAPVFNNRNKAPVPIQVPPPWFRSQQGLVIPPNNFNARPPWIHPNVRQGRQTYFVQRPVPRFSQVPPMYRYPRAGNFQRPPVWQNQYPPQYRQW